MVVCGEGIAMPCRAVLFSASFRLVWSLSLPERASDLPSQRSQRFLRSRFPAGMKEALGMHSTCYDLRDTETGWFFPEKAYGWPCGTPDGPGSQPTPLVLGCVGKVWAAVGLGHLWFPGPSGWLATARTPAATCPPQARPTVPAAPLLCLVVSVAERPASMGCACLQEEVLYIFRLSLSTRRSRPLAACLTFPFNQPKLNNLRTFWALPLP